MTTASWSTAVDHSSDAGFRAWGSELGTKFAAVGMLQTADTGQINWGTVTRAASNVAAGYEIWTTSDASLCFKIEYGTGGSAALPGIWITTGESSNGSGTLTGQLSTRTQTGLNLAIASTTTQYQSYLCATAAFFGLCWKIASTNTAGLPRSVICVGRTVDNTGAPSTVGYYQFTATTASNTTALLQTVRTQATAATGNQSTSYCVIVGVPAASTDGVNNQAYIHWLNTPGVQPAMFTATIIAAELGAGNTVSMTLVGNVAHTYICVSTAVNLHLDAAATTNPVLGLIMLWE